MPTCVMMIMYDNLQQGADGFKNLCKQHGQVSLYFHSDGSDNSIGINCITNCQKQVNCNNMAWEPGKAPEIFTLLEDVAIFRTEGALRWTLGSGRRGTC